MLNNEAQHAAPAPAGQKAKPRSVRTCIATREERAPEEMIRFVLDPDGVITPDLAGKLPGRGAWVTASRDAIEAACAKGLFSRAFKKEARFGIAGSQAKPDRENEPDRSMAELIDGLVGQISDLLAERTLNGVGLARRAGELTPGFEKTHSALKAGKAGVVLTASDAADDGAGKLQRLAGHMDTPVIRAFSVEALSGACGLNGVRHLALMKGTAASRVLRDAERLAGFCPVFAATNAAH